MPRSKAARQRRSSSAKKVVQPFSLILELNELSILRKIAKERGTSVGGVVRVAIQTVIYRNYPGMMRRLVESEADAFLDLLAMRLPSSLLTSAKRKAFKERLVKDLV